MYRGVDALYILLVPPTIFAEYSIYHDSIWYKNNNIELATCTCYKENYQNKLFFMYFSYNITLNYNDENKHIKRYELK